MHHKIRVCYNGETRIVLVRDTSVGISDRHLQNPDPVVWGTTARRGYLTHKVSTPTGFKHVSENLATGALTMGGRRKPSAMGFVWDPTPPVLTVMRCKTPPMAELVAKPRVPVVPERVTARRNTPTAMPFTVGKPGRPIDPLGPTSRARLWRSIRFISEAT